MEDPGRIDSETQRKWDYAGINLSFKGLNQSEIQKHHSKVSIKLNNPDESFTPFTKLTDFRPQKLRDLSLSKSNHSNIIKINLFKHMLF